MYLLHYAPDNASMIIRLFMDGAGLRYRLALVDRKTRQQNSATYRKLNPSGLIPTLETPVGPIAETAAILLWLADRHGLAPTPHDPDRAPLLHWLFFLSNTLHADLRQLFYPSLYVPGEATAAHHDIIVARLQSHFAILDGVAARHPGIFRPTGLLAPYVAALMRWSVLYPIGQSPWFDAAKVPTLLALAAAMEAAPQTKIVADSEGLGPTPFTAPRLANPILGSAT